MSLIAEARPNETSVYTYLDQSPSARAGKAADPTRKPAETSDAGWGEIIDQLIDIARLQDDWDGAGSAAPGRGVIAGANRLAQALRAKKEQAPGRVTPSVNGTICFEWHLDDGWLEIEVTSPMDAEQVWVANGVDIAEVTAIAIVSWPFR
jgi:hypothetical protein